MEQKTGKCANQLAVGYRVWTESGFREYGRNKATVPPATAGVIVNTEQEFPTIDQLLYEVEWDSGQTSVHYAGDLLAIGRFQNLAAFEDYAVAEAAGAEKVLGPNHGLRRAKITLKNGDWINGIYGLESRLQSAGISIKMEILSRKPRLKRIS